MDPVTAFAGVILYSIVVFSLRDLVLLFLVSLSLLAISLPHSKGLSRYSKGSKGLLTMIAIVSMVQLIVHRGGPAFYVDLPPLGRLAVVTVEGMESAGIIAARLTVLVFSALVFVSSVDESAFLEGMKGTGLPKELVLAVNIVLRTLPRMMEDASDIRTAYLMLHGKGPRSGPVTRWKVYFRSLRPLFITYMQHAYLLGLSLESRGWETAARRQFKGRTMGWRDAIAIAAYVTVIVILGLQRFRIIDLAIVS